MRFAFINIILLHFYRNIILTPAVKFLQTQQNHRHGKKQFPPFSGSFLGSCRTGRNDSRGNKKRVKIWNLSSAGQWGSAGRCRILRKAGYFLFECFIFPPWSSEVCLLPSQHRLRHDQEAGRFSRSSSSSSWTSEFHWQQAWMSTKSQNTDSKLKSSLCTKTTAWKHFTS